MSESVSFRHAFVAIVFFWLCSFRLYYILSSLRAVSPTLLYVDGRILGHEERTYLNIIRFSFFFPEIRRRILWLGNAGPDFLIWFLTYLLIIIVLALCIFSFVFALLLSYSSFPPDPVLGAVCAVCPALDAARARLGTHRGDGEQFCILLFIACMCVCVCVCVFVCFAKKLCG
jgi:hypothetical protein